MTQRPARWSTSVSETLDRGLLHKTWPPRLIQVLLGAWLLLTLLLWEHGRVQAVVTGTAGGLAILLGLVSAWVKPLRLLLGLVGVWLLMGTLLATASVGTLVNNIFAALLITFLSLAPRGDVSLFRARHRHV